MEQMNGNELRSVLIEKNLMDEAGIVPLIIEHGTAIFII